MSVSGKVVSTYIFAHLPQKRDLTWLTYFVACVVVVVEKVLQMCRGLLQGFVYMQGLAVICGEARRPETRHIYRAGHVRVF